MIKAAFFDIDGTLFSHKSHCIPPSTIKALSLLKEKNIITSICTGRHLAEIKVIDFFPIEFDYTIALNGQVILDAFDRIIESYPFDDKDLESIHRIYNEKKVSIMAVEMDGLYLNTISDAAIKAYTSFCIPMPKTGNLTGGPVYQLMAYGSEEEVFSVAKEVNGKAVWWNDLSVDIIPQNGGKDRGILKLCEMLNIKSDEVITFGDGNNDIPMFKITPYSVAMGNASDAVKKEASYVTTDIDDDGIYNALKHFGVI